MSAVVPVGWPQLRARCADGVSSVLPHWMDGPVVGDRYLHISPPPPTRRLDAPQTRCALDGRSSQSGLHVGTAGSGRPLESAPIAEAVQLLDMGPVGRLRRWSCPRHMDALVHVQCRNTCACALV